MTTPEVSLSIALASAYAGVAIPKLMRIQYFKTAFEHLRMPAAALTAVGGAELLAAGLLLAGLASSGLAVAGDALIVALMVGAVGTHLRAGDPPRAGLPATVLGAAAGLQMVLIV